MSDDAHEMQKELKDRIPELQRYKNRQTLERENADLHRQLSDTSALADLRLQTLKEWEMEKIELRKQLEHLSDKYNMLECTADAWKIRAEKAERQLEQAEKLCMWKL